MGDGFSKVVMLIVAAFTMVVELKIDTISYALNNMEISGTGLMLGFSWNIPIITFISGSGNAVFIVTLS